MRLRSPLKRDTMRPIGVASYLHGRKVGGAGDVGDVSDFDVLYFKVKLQKK